MPTDNCCWCGCPDDRGDPSWSFARERGVVTRACPACVREHLTLIEA